MRSTLYRLLNRCTPCDVTYVLAAKRFHTPTTAPPEGYQIEPLTQQLWESLSKAPGENDDPTSKPNFADHLLHGINQQSLTAIVAHTGKRAVAHAFFSTIEVPPHLNSGGNRFHGIGLQLPPNSCYLFKAYADPAHRGNNLLPAMVHRYLALPECQNIKTLITTTEWTNHAFLTQANRLGFKKLGVAAEWVIGQRHTYRIPDLSHAPTGQRLRLLPARSSIYTSGDK